MNLLPPGTPRAALSTLALAATLALAGPLHAGQGSAHALRFHGTGSGAQDRALVKIDDLNPGPDASAPCDVGAQGFTLDFWVRGTLADNTARANGAGDVWTPDSSWRNANVLLDRHVPSGTARTYGVGIAGGHVRFGVGRGDTGGGNATTIEGSTNVLDGLWHHVACLRDRQSGVLAIFVDGQLDYASPAGLSTADVSFPDNGPLGNPPAVSAYLGIGAEKFDTGPTFPSFSGWLDELRIWSASLTPAQIGQTWWRVVPGDTPNLVAAYRFEEGAGATLADSSAAGSPEALLIAGVPGNGEWTSGELDPLAVAPVVDDGLPPGFQRTLIDDTLSDPTALEIAPDGRVFVAKHDGTILVVQNGLVLPQPLIQIPVTVTWGSRGLLGLVLDPGFALNGWIYVFHTTLEPRNRVSRFTVVGNTASPASEQVIWEHSDPAGDDHHGGALCFGGDGMLYIATGDAFDSSLSQQIGSESGKILRVAPDGSVPSDNPYVGVAGAHPTIWLRGVRNPFRTTYDPSTDRLYVGDVGGNNATAWEELDLVTKDANLGWPLQEGQDCYVSDCSPFQPPVWTYRHDAPGYFWKYPQGSITLGPVYLGNAFPGEYRGNLFVGDYANRWIRRLVLGATGQVLAAPVFLRLAGAGSVVDMEVGPDGALYYVTYAAPGGHSFADVGALYRISYGGGTNIPPVAVAGASPKTGSPPLHVQFNGLQSYDPDGGPQALSYAWDFGDGTGSNQPDPAHVYSVAGAYEAVLTVSDGKDSTQSDPIALEVGSPPVVTMIRPAPGQVYAAGDQIDLSGFADDPEDGPIPAQGLEWYVTLVHAGHTHPFAGPIQGKAGSFVVPSTGHAPEDTYYSVSLKATDSHQQSSTLVRPMVPDVSEIALDTWPSGIPLFVDGQAEATPRLYGSLTGYDLQLAAQRSFVLNGRLWLFRYWGDGGAMVHTYATPSGGGDVRAIYSPGVTRVVTASVPAIVRNAEWSPAVGQSHASPGTTVSLAVGRRATGELQMGLEFLLDVPRGAVVLSAALEVTAAVDQAGAPAASIRAYASDDAPVFSSGSPTALTAWAPLTTAQQSWTFPPFATGGVYSSPDLAALVQEVVDRPGWDGGNAFGLVLDGAATSGLGWRSVASFSSGQGPRLRVTYAVPQKLSPGPPAVK